jgi:hypothetical protein
MRDGKPFYRFAKSNVKEKNTIKEASPDVYKSALQTMYVGKVNMACICKLALLEGDSIKKYTFNEAKLSLQEWIDDCKNEACFKKWFETFQKCKCS